MFVRLMKLTKDTYRCRLSCMDIKAIEKILWTNLLNRLEIEKKTCDSNAITFLFESGSVEGVAVTNFQVSAIDRLLKEGAITGRTWRYSIPESEKYRRALFREPLPQPIGCEIIFEQKNDVFDSIIHFLRLALDLGDINARPVFEFQLHRRDLAIWDFERRYLWKIHKMNMASYTDQIFTLMFTEGVFDLTRQYLEERNIKVTKRLGDVVRNVKLKGDLASAFFITSNDRLVLRRVVTQHDLAILDLTTDSIRKQLQRLEGNQKPIRGNKNTKRH